MHWIPDRVRDDYILQVRDDYTLQDRDDFIWHDRDDRMIQSASMSFIFHKPVT